MGRRGRMARGAALVGFSLLLFSPALKAALSAPSLTATAVSTSQIRLNWTDPNQQETGFQIQRSTSSTTGFVLVYTAAKDATTYTNSGLASGVTYYFRVRAISNSTTSSYSNVASARTLVSSLTGIPAAPSGLAAAAYSSSQINIAWTDNSTNETAFAVERATSSAGPFTQIGTTAASGYGSSGLSPSTTYWYRVRAYNSSGYSAYSNTASATTQSGTGGPAAPTSLTATAASTTQINLAWVDASSNESGFRIERSTATSAWGEIATVGVNVRTYSSTGLAGGTTYSYRVRSYNASGTSGYSNTASATTTGGSSGARWSRRFGNTTDDRGQSVAVDGSGNVAVTGHLDGTTDFGGGSVSSYVHPTMGPTVDIVVASYTSSGGYRWARVIGSDSAEEGKGVATDGSGNVIITGYQGSYSVDYGGGPQFVRSGNDIFVAKYSAAGSWVWSKTVGGLGYDQGNAVAADGQGNVVVTGYVGASSTGIDLGGGTLSASATGYDCFVAKYSSTGAYQWAKRIGGTGNDYGYGIGTDTAGNVFVAGTFEGSVNFGGGSLTSSGLRDVFVVKYTAAGAFAWAKKFGSSGDDAVSGLATDAAGDVAISGKFQGSVNFGGGSLSSAGGDDGFVAKLSGATGGHLWSKRFGSTSSDVATGVDADGSGNIVVAGYYAGAVDFGGGVLSSLGVDVFAVKYTSAGAHVWSKRFGSADSQLADGVAAAGNGNVVVTGFFAATVDFGSGLLTTAGGYDGFLTNIGP